MGKKAAKDPERDFKDAISVLEGEYREEIASLAEEYAKRSEKDEEAAGEWLTETLDGHEWVIYTHRAQVVVLVSRNDGAYFERFGAEGVVQDGAINWSGLAMAAMEQDVIDWQR